MVVEVAKITRRMERRGLGKIRRRASRLGRLGHKMTRTLGNAFGESGSGLRLT